MVPFAVLKRDREDVRDRVVEGLPARGGIVLLRIVRARSDHEVRVMARVDDDGGDRVGREGRVLVVQLAGEVDPRLCLVLRRMFLCVGIEDAPLGLASLRQGHLIVGVRTVEQPGDHAVLPFVDRGRAGLAAHRPVDGFDGHLAGKSGGIGLPGGYFALARLASRCGGVQRLADRLEDHLRRELEHRADSRGGRGAEVSDVIDLVRVQADGLHEVDLDLVAGGDAANEVGARAAHVLRHRNQRRDVVAGVRVFGGEEGVVVVELTNGHAVCPGRPLGAEATRDAEYGRSGNVGVVLGLRPGGNGRSAGEGGCGHRRVVDQPIDHHLGDL